MSLDRIDVIERNEIFAAQAIESGHPLGMSERVSRCRRCIGVKQGIAALLGGV